jgi:hypothetical protein
MAWRIAHYIDVAVPVPKTWFSMPCFHCRRRIAKATGGQVVMALADMDGNETFEASNLGTADEVAPPVPTACNPSALWKSSFEHQA